MNNLNNEGEGNPENQFLFVNQPVLPPHSERIRSQDILEISREFIPSLLYIIFLILSNNSTMKYCDESVNTIIKSCLIFQTFFFVKSIVQIVTLYFDMKNYIQYAFLAADYTLTGFYFIFIIFSYSAYKNLPNECLYSNTFTLIVVFSIVTLGIFDILRHLFNSLLIIVGFPIMLYYFFQDPGDFIQRFGVDPDIIDNWPTSPAAPDQNSDCVICSEEIKEGQQIMILNCNGRHYYHAPCIKEWLKHRVNCPVCRSNNVF